MRYSKKTKKSVAIMLFSVLASQLLLPNIALALTTGPTQPEVQSFEPVGTTDMVDMFSGDFVYNVPLMDVEGYPVNISYHGGVTMEQEASWVGLGWNINPGVINRSVRGVPDDFNGDTLSKELHIKEEKTLRVGIGVGGELFGVGDPLLSLSASLGANLTFNNYRGTSCDINMGAGINLFKCVSAGVNIGVGSQTGAEIDYNANLSLASSQLLSKDIGGGVGVGVSQGYSSRSGLKDMNLTFSATAIAGGSSTSQSFTNTIPIGVKNFVPVITNSSNMISYSGRIKFGGELLWCLGYLTANGMFSRVRYSNDGSKDAYGYLYLENSQNPASVGKCILDFTRDKDGQFNKTMQYLPPASLTYDIYNVSGQGTGGVFRPYRNDIGAVYDPITHSHDTSYSACLEAGAGWLFEIGGDYTHSETDIKSGPWVESPSQPFTNRSNGSIYENVYFKQAGELTEVDSQYFQGIHGTSAVTPGGVGSLPYKKPNSASKRDARSNLIYYFTAEEHNGLGGTGVGLDPYIYSYTTNGFASGPDAPKTTINRVGSNKAEHRKDEVSEIVQLQKDGRKYVYGLPALNHVQKEATFSVNHSSADLSSGLVGYSTSDNSTSNTQGIDNYYSATTTPSYVHSYLLTSVLSADYVDVTGNGVSDDDLGSFTKLNYSRKEADYRWKAPYEAGKAQYNPGFRSDPRDDKGSVVCGSREQWMLHSIETKNFVAEFYTSQRNDACGGTEPIAPTGHYAIAPYNTGLSTPAASYKLDSIKLYNKHDRFINKTSAIPVKSVFFVYSDTLCKGVPNTLTGGSTRGKLTLDKIYFRYGNSDRSMISPYQFEYGYNPNYSPANKDRWGSYKPSGSTLTNFEFPFVNQDDVNNNMYASAWSLTNISLPSGGTIQAQYECDDYAFVQDKVANEMFVVKGIGNGPGFNPSNRLYADENSPYLYVYFKRRVGKENPALSFKDNYFKNGDDIVYFNFNVKLNDVNVTSFEQIKGYAHVTNIGACPGGVYGYIQLEPVVPTGGEAVLNPVTYTAINTGRYYLPNVIFPGSGADPNDFDILAGLNSAFEELVSIFKNPVVRLVKQKHNARTVDITKSFIRLQSPGLAKKGGGQRVKSLMFHDAWSALAGGNEQDATYGKRYNYTIQDDTWGTISSGVASYEPEIGGDENPFRQPVPYIVSSGSSFPPNDPVDLYQETPIGESLFPPASVGYRKVTVSSINSAVGKSSQGVDVYQFYTAKDVPVKVVSTAINTSFKHKFSFFKQENEMEATQGYSLVLNDMHGKPKSVEHYVHHPGSVDQMISYQLYNYHMKDGQLDNHVDCLVYDQVSNSMKVQNKQLGVEADITIDSRHKDEDTRNNTYNCNLNVSGIFFIIIPIFLAFEYEGQYRNQFKSATVTKVVQQYGILDNVQAYNEGAVTIQRNELYDPETGQVVVTSINNEYQDRQYTTNIPAYWGYTGMGPAYSNIKFEKTIDSISIDPDRLGRFQGMNNLNIGDEVILTYQYGGSEQTITAWVIGAKRVLKPWCTGCCYSFILPRFPTAAPGWSSGNQLNNVHLKVISSGAKNMLNETIENYTMMDKPIDATGTLKTSLTNLVSINAKTFCDSTTKILGKYLLGYDTINPYAIGERGIYRPLSEYVYVKNRNYSVPSARNSGLFNAPRLFSQPAYDQSSCSQFPFRYNTPFKTDSWQVARTITKWSPFGKEVENRDAVGNYSAAVYGYNDDLPVAVASNALQGEVLAEAFEDYKMVRYKRNLMKFDYSPFRKYFDTAALSAPSAVYNILELSNPSDLSIVSTAAHTGKHALSVPVSSGGITGIYAMNIPVNLNNYSGVNVLYNMHYVATGYSYNSATEYLPFKLSRDKSYVLSFWVRQASPAANLTTYAIHDSCGVKVGTTFHKATKRSNIIDGWQQLEVSFKVPGTATTAALRLPANYYIDDVRFFPSDANIKSFVYHPVNEKLMATLDENNFATLYEYDQEGNLVRVKKETERGIMTVSESRSNNPKK